MALSPVFRDFCNELDHFHSHFFDGFPADLRNDNFFQTPLCNLFRHPFCSHCCCKNNDCEKARKEPSCCPRVSVGKDGFEMSMNVKQFKPEEITVKTLDNMVRIEGKQQQSSNDRCGSFSRHFVRSYTLPRGYNPEQVMSIMSPDGVLTVKAPAPQKIPDVMERIVPIQHNALTGSGN